MTNQNGLKAVFRALAGKNRLAKHYIKKKLAQDAGEHWVTVNAGSKEGGEGGGSHVLLDGEGRVVAGMGGKFKGQNIDRIERKKFINQNAWGRQRKALTEKAGDDTVLKRAVTAGMRSQAEKETDTSNDKWQKEGLYKAITRKTQQENKGIINVLHDYVDRMNAKSKTPNPIAEKIQKQSDGVKQIVTEAITKYNDLEAVNQLRDIPDGVNVVTEKGQFFKTGDLWSSPDGKKTLEHDQMLRQLKKELKSQISNKDMDNLVANELEKVQYKDVAERVKDIDPQLAKEIENTENKYNELKAENIAKAERSEHEKKRGGGHAISFEEQNTEKKLQELKAQAEAKIAEGKQEEPKVDRKSLIDQVNARHTMPMGDIIARKEQAITDKINSSNLSEADKKKYLDKLNSLTDEALKAGAGSLDLYKVGVSYKKTNAESNAFNKMFSKQSEIDNLEKEINKKVQDKATQSENKSVLNSLNEAERAGAVYFKDANGKEFYRANAKSRTWNVANEYNKDALEKAKARQAKIDARSPVHSVTVDTVTDNVRDAIKQKGDLQSAYATLKDQIAGLKEGAYVVNYQDGAVYRKTGNGLQYESSHFGWRDVDMKPEEFFKGNKLHIGIGNTPEDAKANYKETEIMPMNHDYVASSVKAKLENSTGGHPRTALGLALMNTLNDIPAGTFVKGKDGGPMYKKTASGWVIPGLEYKPITPDVRVFESNGDLTLGIGKTAEEAKANTKTTELQVLKKHDAEQVEKAEREKAEKAERKERSKDFYLNKIDKIKDSMNKGENYSSDLYKSELYKSLLSKANHGNTEEVNRVLNELKKEGIYTDRHRIWGLADVAKKNADYIAERHEKADKTTTALKGATVNKEVYNGEARTSVKFDNIPNYATRVALKQNGFKWNADAGEWYKSEGENGAAHENIINTLKDQGFNEQPKAETPTAQPRQATPTQQAEGKQYHGTGIENKNGRFEVSFNEFPSYKLRTDMKNNGFKWDPNTKVWHTTDREKLDQVLSRHFTERT